jgi:hypothetical protein
VGVVAPLVANYGIGVSLVAYLTTSESRAKRFVTGKFFFCCRRDLIQNPECCDSSRSPEEQKSRRAEEQKSRRETRGNRKDIFKAHKAKKGSINSN